MLMYNKEAVPLLSVGKKEMGQPYVNTFSSLEPSGSHSSQSLVLVRAIVSAGGRLRLFSERLTLGVLGHVVSALMSC